METKNKETLKNFLLDNLSSRNYNDLPKILGKSRKMTTILINNPERLNAIEIKTIAELCNIESSIFLNMING